MALYIRNELTEEPESFSLEGFSNGEFIISNDKDPSEKFTIEFPFDTSNVPSGYTVTLFAFENNHFSQNDIFELRTTEREKDLGRIGYIFSLKALTDKENNIFNKHTLPFAYYAFESLIEAENELKSLPAKRKDSFKLTDFYNENLIFVVLCDQLTKDIPIFSFDDYLYALYLHGFVFVEFQSKKISHNSRDIIKKEYNQAKDNFHNGRYPLKLTPAPRFLRDEIYPCILAKQLISDEHFFLTKFHSLYQVIEILINEVLKNEIQTNINDTFSGFKLKKKLSKIATDGYRVNALIHQYATVSSGIDSAIIEKLKTFFSDIKIEIESGEEEADEDTEFNSNKFSTLIYKLRNTLVHNYRLLYKNQKTKTHLAQLEEINEYFAILIFQLLHSFKKPTAVKNSLEHVDVTNSA